MPYSLRRASRRRLGLNLLAQRPDLGALERDALVDRLLVDHRLDWVRGLEDPFNTVRHDGAVATRAITAQGRLLWIVREAREARVYHARAADPCAAIAEAREARRRRNAIRANRAEIARVIAGLRSGALRFEVRIEDAYASPLCAEGVDGFMRAVGLSRLKRAPGWFVAWLFALDKRVGLVIHEAHRRALREGAVPAQPPAGLASASTTT